MKGFIGKAVALAGLSAGFSAATGCCGYYDVVDPCYPARYNAMARREVCEPLAAQSHNGHVLDQTIWNYHFEPGTDKLTPGGYDHLMYILRRRPCPDQTVFLATAEDLATPYDVANPDKFIADRGDLDAKRTVAVQKYLNAQTAGRGVAFQVVTHDPAEAGLHANPMGLSITRWWGSFQGQLPASSSTGGAVSGGAGGR